MRAPKPDTEPKLDSIDNTAGVGTVTVASAVRMANWSDIGAENGTVSGSMYTMHVTHNHAAVASVDGAGLAYMVVPATPTTRPLVFDPAPYTYTTTVVSCSNRVHAVLTTAWVSPGGVSSRTMTLSAAFFESGGSVNIPAPWGLTITSMQPAAVLAERNDARNGAGSGPNVLLTVSDPTQLLAEMSFKTSAYGVVREIACWGAGWEFGIYPTELTF